MLDAETLGNDLRQARQQRKLTLLQVEQQIKVRAKYLEALEQGQYALLPSEVHTRGFLRNYARFLGLDADLIASQYDEIRQGKRRRSRRAAPLSPPPASDDNRANGPTPVVPAPARPAPYGTTEEPRRRLWPVLLIAGLIMIPLMGVLVVLGSQAIQSMLAGGPGGAMLSPIAPRLTPTAIGTETPRPTPTPLRPTPLPNPNVPPPTTPAGSTQGPLSVQLQIIARTWLQVLVDGQVSYIGAPGPNTILQYQGTVIKVRASNGVGVRAIVNDQDLGILGARGQIIDQTYTLGGVLQATPTQLPTAQPGETPRTP